MVTIQLCRVGFYLFITDLFSNVTFSKFIYLLYAGLKFDLSALLYLNALFILVTLLPFKFRFNTSYKYLVNTLYLVPITMGIISTVSDFIYCRFTVKRTTSSVFDFVAGEDNMCKLFFRFIFHYWYATFLGAVLILGLSVELYNYTIDKGLKRNIIESNTDVLLSMENKLKACIQLYNNRVLDNNMTP